MDLYSKARDYDKENNPTILISTQTDIKMGELKLG